VFRQKVEGREGGSFSEDQTLGTRRPKTSLMLTY
jgi:hypothetical protein